MFYLKLVWLYVLSMTTSILIYPFLHEVGHLLAALAFNADVLDLSIFPLPYVAVALTNASAYKQAIIAMAGLFMPMIAFVVNAKRLSWCVIVITLRVICVFAWFISGVSIIHLLLGNRWSEEDVVKAVDYIGGCEGLMMFFCFALCAVFGYMTVKSRTVDRIIGFFL